MLFYFFPVVLFALVGLSKATLVLRSFPLIVAAGLAWHYTKYSSDEEYDRLESIASENKVGLWADKDPTPSWKWRKGKDNKNK